MCAFCRFGLRADFLLVSAPVGLDRFFACGVASAAVAAAATAVAAFEEGFAWYRPGMPSFAT